MASAISKKRHFYRTMAHDLAVKSRSFVGCRHPEYQQNEHNLLASPSSHWKGAEREDGRVALLPSIPGIRWPWYWPSAHKAPTGSLTSKL